MKWVISVYTVIYKPFRGHNLNTETIYTWNCMLTGSNIMTVQTGKIQSPWNHIKDATIGNLNLHRHNPDNSRVLLLLPHAYLFIFCHSMSLVKSLQQVHEGWVKAKLFPHHTRNVAVSNKPGERNGILQKQKQLDVSWDTWIIVNFIVCIY